MKVSYNWLQTYFDKKLPEPEKLASLINDHAFEVEGAEKLADDTVLDLKILPDRAHYALCHRGIAREIRAIADMALKPSSVPSTAPEEVQAPDVKIGEPKLCRRYIARRIENVSVVASPERIKNALEAIGARAINSIVDATNHVMFDIGQPLHAFDADKVEGSIRVRLAAAGETITLLDGKEAELKESDLVIADDKGPLAIAGVKGGKRAEVTDATKNVILESANFDPVAVRRTSTRLNLRNDSSKRFENEIIPELAGEAMERVTAHILELSKGAKASALTDVFLKHTHPSSIKVSPEAISAMIGMKIGKRDFEEMLARLDISFIEEGGSYALTPPQDRLDLKIPEDIADEVARLKGYGDLDSALPPDLRDHASLDKDFYWSEKAKNILIGLGFSETLLYTLVPKGAFEISYPLASDKKALRESIQPKMEESLKMNALNADLLGHESVRIFEIGKVFPKEGEQLSLAIGAVCPKKRKGVTAEGIVKDAVKRLEEELKIDIRGKIDTGAFGAILEIDFGALVSKLSEPKALKTLDLKALPEDKRYKPFSPYPFIVRDIAFFAPSGTSEKDAHAVVLEAVLGSGGKLLAKGPDLFDTFEKDKKISFGFRMIFQSFEKTLSDDEANSIMEKVYAAVKKEGWEPR